VVSEGREEHGFTLVELAIVTIVMSVLAGIAIGTYVSQAEKARGSAASSSLKTAYLVAETLRIDADPPGYTVAHTAYAAEQAALSWVGSSTPSDDPLVVSVAGDRDTHVVFAVRGGARCFYERLEIGAEGPVRHVEPIGGDVECRADEFPLGDPRSTP
jgi:prepilin-type N-terminal cleavage/methylation domain-containing protein